MRKFSSRTFNWCKQRLWCHHHKRILRNPHWKKNVQNSLQRWSRKTEDKRKGPREAWNQQIERNPLPRDLEEEDNVKLSREWMVVKVCSCNASLIYKMHALRESRHLKAQWDKERDISESVALREPIQPKVGNITNFNFFFSTKN